MEGKQVHEFIYSEFLDDAGTRIEVSFLVGMIAGFVLSSKGKDSDKHGVLVILATGGKEWLANNLTYDEASKVKRKFELQVGEGQGNNFKQFHGMKGDTE